MSFKDVHGWDAVAKLMSSKMTLVTAFDVVMEMVHAQKKQSKSFQ